MLAIHRRFGYASIRVEKQSIATPRAIDSADPAQQRRLTRAEKCGDKSLQNAPRAAMPVSLLREPQ